MPWAFCLPQENKETAWNPWIPYLLNRLKKEDLLLKLDYAQVLIFFKKYLFIFFIVVQVQFSAFSPHPSPTPQSSHLPSLFPPPPTHYCPCSFIIVPPNPSSFSPEIPSPLSSGHCQPVLNVSVFGYILLVVCFVD